MFKGLGDALAGAKASLKEGLDNALVAGISVKNESRVPPLVVCSQLTPLY